MQLGPIPNPAKTEVEFWREFLNFLNSLSRRPLTERELDVMSLYLTSPEKNPLRGKPRKELRAVLGIREQTLSMHIASIKEKGWLTAEGKSFILPTDLEVVRDRVKSTSDYSITITMNISLDDTRQDSRKVGAANRDNGTARKDAGDGLLERDEKDMFIPTG